MARNRFLLFMIVSSLVFFVLAPVVAAAAELDDGTYAIDYVVLQADNDSVSIANDYFRKPATLTVENGKQQLLFTVQHSEWVKELKVETGGSFVDVTVVREDTENDSRIVAIQTDADLSQPIYMQMHVRITSMEPVYDHQYTVRFRFDVASKVPIDPPPEAAIVPMSNDSSFKLNQTLVMSLVALSIFAALVLIRTIGSSKKKNK